MPSGAFSCLNPGHGMAIRAGPDPLLDERAGCHCPPIQRPVECSACGPLNSRAADRRGRDARVAVPKLFGDVNRIVPERRPQRSSGAAEAVRRGFRDRLDAGLSEPYVCRLRGGARSRACALRVVCRARRSFGGRVTKLDRPAGSESYARARSQVPLAVRSGDRPPAVPPAAVFDPRTIIVAFERSRRASRARRPRRSGGQRRPAWRSEAACKCQLRREGTGFCSTSTTIFAVRCHSPADPSFSRGCS